MPGGVHHIDLPLNNDNHPINQSFAYLIFIVASEVLKALVLERQTICVVRLVYWSVGSHQKDIENYLWLVRAAPQLWQNSWQSDALTRSQGLSGLSLRPSLRFFDLHLSLLLRCHRHIACALITLSLIPLCCLRSIENSILFTFTSEQRFFGFTGISSTAHP